MRQAYRVLALLIAAGVVVQAAAIALGWFLTLNDLDDGLVLEGDFEGNVGHTLHSTVGIMVIPLLALVLLGVSFFTKAPGAVAWAGFVVLAVALQITLAFVSYGAPAVGALHGINAFVVGGLAGAAASRIQRPSPAEQNQPVAA